ncbi:MAG: cysteine dioxygenase [Polaribacter sp.]
MESTKSTQNSLQTLSELILVLDEEERAKYTTILKSMELPIAEFEKHATWSGTCYTRNCIAENEDFELILLCWEKGQVTAIHDHGGEECWVYFVEGEFREHVYTENKNGELDIVKTTNIKPGDVGYMIDFMGFHNLENRSNKRSMTLHLYAKPIKNCNVYDSEKNEFINKEMSYDNVNEIHQSTTKNNKKICLN